LRLLGLGKQRETAAQMAQDLFVWNWIGFAIVVTGGFMLFSGIATSFIGNIAFQWKLGLFVPTALVWHVIVQRKARSWGQGTDTPGIAKLAALTEILLWICVVTAAVEIPNH
jgi:membrane protein implicated in regulation of membrane protease activity